MTDNDYDKQNNEHRKDEEFYQLDENPESTAETNRKSGLAYSAVLMLVASILGFLGIGWALDRFFNTEPWLLVGGIVLGTIIGFYQFIRISSQLN